MNDINKDFLDLTAVSEVINDLEQPHIAPPNGDEKSLPISISKKLTWDHLTSREGFNLDVSNVREVDSRAHPTFAPRLPILLVSNELIGFLETYRSNYSPRSEASRRLIIDAVLEEAIKISGHTENRKLCLESKLNLPGVWDNQDVSYNGNVDYSVGSDDAQTSFMFVIEAKNGISVNVLSQIYENAIIQTVGYMGAIF